MLVGEISLINAGLCNHHGVQELLCKLLIHCLPIALLVWLKLVSCAWVANQTKSISTSFFLLYISRAITLLLPSPLVGIQVSGVLSFINEQQKLAVLSSVGH
jgi:hypothetical protein